MRYAGSIEACSGAIEAAPRRLSPPPFDPRRELQQAPFLDVTPPSTRTSMIVLNPTESAILTGRKPVEAGKEPASGC